MKYYNVKNYVRYKEDLISQNHPERYWQHYTREELIIKFLPLVESIARSFNVDEQASGIMNIEDLIQEGSIGLIKAVDKWDVEFALSKVDPEKSIKSFFLKRIRGAIRRAIDINRGSMRIPEHKINEIRNNENADQETVKTFFNAIFKSIDADTSGSYYNIPDLNKEYRVDMLNSFILGLMKKNLSHNEYHVLRLSYGLDCRKHSAKEISFIVGISVSSSHVRISQIKKQAINKMSEKIKLSQVIDFL
jgi:RNA polymerase sigma factor (sigma-70 family)